MGPPPRSAIHDANEAARILAQVSRDDDERVSAKLNRYVAELHEKINVVDKAVTGLEVETRILGRTIQEIARKLNVTSV